MYECVNACKPLVSSPELTRPFHPVMYQTTSERSCVLVPKSFRALRWPWLLAAVVWYIYVCLQPICCFSSEPFPQIGTCTCRSFSREHINTLPTPLLVLQCPPHPIPVPFLLQVFLYALITTIDMPEETRYVTLSGNVPNGGVPPHRTFASVVGLPFRPHPGPYLFSGGYGPPPPYYGPQDSGK